MPDTEGLRSAGVQAAFGQGPNTVAVPDPAEGAGSCRMKVSRIAHPDHDGVSNSVPTRGVGNGGDCRELVHPAPSESRQTLTKTGFLKEDCTLDNFRAAAARNTCEHGALK